MLSSIAGWNHPHVYPEGPWQPYASNEARADAHHPSIESGHVCIRVEHWDSIGEDAANTVSGKLERANG